MLKLTDQIPVFITDYIHENYSTATPDQIQVYKADLGWLLYISQPDMNRPQFSIFGELISDSSEPSFSAIRPIVYINRNAPLKSEEYCFEIAYAYGNDKYALRTNLCDTEFTAKDLADWITDEYRHLETTELTFDDDSAVNTFLNNVTEDSYHGTSIIRDMLESRQYPFCFIKDVKWLN